MPIQILLSQPDLSLIRIASLGLKSDRDRYYIFQASRVSIPNLYTIKLNPIVCLVQSDGEKRIAIWNAVSFQAECTHLENSSSSILLDSQFVISIVLNFAPLKHIFTKKDFDLFLIKVFAQSQFYVYIEIILKH